MLVHEVLGHPVHSVVTVEMKTDVSGFDDNLVSTTTMETMTKLHTGDEIFVTMSIQGNSNDSGMLSFKLTPAIIFTGQWISEF